MPRPKRILDKEQSFEKYKQRMELKEDSFSIFEGGYLSTFEVYSTVMDIEEHSDMDCFAGVLLRLLRSKGIHVKGVTSERKQRGEYICSTLLDGESRDSALIIYVGKYSYFSGHNRSEWSPNASDNVYHPPPADVE